MSKSSNPLQGHRFFVTFCYLPEEQIKLRSLLELNGGTVVESVQDADYIVTDTWEFEDKDDVPENASLVTRKWVEKTLVQGKLLDPIEYSPDPAKLFSGVVACATELESSDVEILSTVIEYLGGSWRSGYTRDVTHLFAIRAGSDKYETAMHFQHQTGVKVLVPHWFDDTIHFGCRDLDTTAYEWPDPQVLLGGPAIDRIKPARRPDLKALHDLPGEKMDLYDGVSAGDSSGQTLPKSLVNEVWGDRKILLSPDLDLTSARLKLVKESIERCSGHVVEYNEDEVDSVTLDQFDVLIARRRWGHLYLQAVRAKKMVGSLAWLFHVQSTGALVSPIDQLLHFPIPKHPVVGFDRQEVTVTNYTGQSRDYLKKLIDLMGGQFTASMSGKNTALVAAFLNGQKTEKAQGWGIPVVNHLWLEDCFLQWKTVSVGTEKYIHFPQGHDFAMQLGRSGLNWQAILDGTQDVEEAMEKQRLERLGEQAQGGMEGLNVDDDAEMEVDDDEAPADEDAMDVDDARAPTPPSRKARSHSTKGASPTKTTPRRGARKVPSRNPPSSSKKRTTDAAASSDEDEDVQSSPTRKPASRPKRSASRLRNTANKPKPASTSRPRRSAGGRAKLGDSPAKSAVDAGDTDTEAAVELSSPTRRLTRSMSRQRAERDDEAASRPNSRVAKANSSKKAQKAVSLEDGDEPEDDDGPRGRTRSRAGPSKPASKSKASTTKSATKGKGKAPESQGVATSRSARSKAALASKNDDPSDTESEDASPTKAAQTRRSDKANAATSPSKPSKPTRRLSVVMPPVGTGRSLSQQSLSRNASPSKGKGKGKALHNNAAGTATDSDEDPPPARLAPAKTPAKTPAKSVPQDLTTPSTAGRARRSAADKATRRLHDEIMPDVNNFQQQLRRGNVRALGEKEREAESRAKDKGKGKAKNDEEKKRRRGSADDEEEDQEEEEEEARDVKKPRTSGKGKAKADSEDVEDSAKKRTGKGRAKAKAADGSDDDEDGPSQTQVRLMTTGWSMSDAMGKKLQKLGMKLVSDVKQCTHLVTNRIARTPNFLLAMAVAPIIVDQSWLDACVKKARILPTDTGEYDLNDPGTEAKYDFKLADAIRRAGENKGLLFGGMTFHVTRAVEVDHKVLRGAIVAHGGTMNDNVTLSERTLQGKPEHYVIASPADSKKFPLLTKGGHSVYTPELVLTSALVQEIRWDNPASILAAP